MGQIVLVRREVIGERLPTRGDEDGDTNIPKISCVNRVQFFSITAHASVSAMTVMHAEAHIPVHASAVAKEAPTRHTRGSAR